MKIGRNEKCPCGSGKKYKKCCLNNPSIRQTPTSPELEQMRLEAEQITAERLRRLEHLGIYVDFVKPVEFKGGKVWALGSKIYPNRPLNQTFHEFIISILYEIIGEEWRQSQLALSEVDRHFIYQCSVKFSEWCRNNAVSNNQARGVWAAFPDGWSKALLSLAFDITSLEHTEHMPKQLLDRLKNRDQYQGARYEVAIAAMFARLGYRIIFLDEQGSGVVHCEFIAEDRITGEQIAVEVKSKEREGVLHTKGATTREKLLWGDIQRLYRHALKQNPGNMPFIIFIDMNAPQTPGSPWEEKPWGKDIKKMLSKVPLNSPANPDPCTTLIFTNYSYHYQTENEALPGEHLLTIPLHSVFPIHNPNFFTRIEAALKNYGNVPNLDFNIES